MRNKQLLSEIYNEFEAFHTMCLSTALMSTYNSNEFDIDADKIITFIGEAFNLKKDVIKSFKDCILGDMMKIGLITDYQAIASVELLSEEDKENIELYEIKGRIIEEIANCEAQNYTILDVRLANQIRANMKYEYFHHPYNSKLRFWQLYRLMKNGNVVITRQVALLYILGIGCEQDFEKAEESLLECLLWGDEISEILIRELYKRTGKTPKEISGLAKILNAHIIAPKKDALINKELAKMLILDELSYKDKVELILNFNEKTWKNATLLIKNKENHIGFKVRKNE